MPVRTLLTFIPALVSLALCFTPPDRIPFNDARPVPPPSTLLSNLLLRLDTSGINPRQATTGCPAQSLNCERGSLCCPGYCCPFAYPFCAKPDSLEYCLNADNKGICKTNGQRVPGTLCLLSANTCCPNPNFDKCTDTLPVACVNDEGFIACGEDEPQPGVDCGGDFCCPNPKRCCERPEGSISCCDPDEPGVFGEPRTVDRRLSKVPAQTPGPVNAGPGMQPSPVPSPLPSRSPFGNGGGSGEEGTGGEGPDSSAVPSIVVTLLPSPIPEGETDSPDVPEVGTITPVPSVVGPAEPSASPTPSASAIGPEGVDGGEGMQPVETGDSEMDEAPNTGAMAPGSPDGIDDGNGNEEGESEMSVSPTDDEDGGSVCWPAGGMVERRDGQVKRMEEIETGDWVRVSGGGFSEVFMWTHRDARYAGRRFVRVELEGERAVTATVGHMVYVRRCGSGGCERVVTEVEKVKVGDGMWGVEGDKEVVKAVVGTGRVWERGLYNPQTVHGDIVVDGVVATCYTRYVERGAAHGLLAPLRALYRWSGVTMSVSL